MGEICRGVETEESLMFQRSYKFFMSEMSVVGGWYLELLRSAVGLKLISSV